MKQKFNASSGIPERFEVNSGRGLDVRTFFEGQFDSGSLYGDGVFILLREVVLRILLVLLRIME